MSNQTQQTPGWGPPPTPQPPQPPKQRRQFTVTKIAVGVAAGIALFIVGIIVVVAIAIGGNSTSGKQTTIATPTTTGAASPAATPITDPPTVQPKPSDFELTVKTLSKQCFGDAGCNITFRVEVAYGGPTLDPSTTWEVTYEIRGPEDGTQVNTLEVTGDQSSVDQEEIASTKSASVKLKAVVTDVSEQ